LNEGGTPRAGLEKSGKGVSAPGRVLRGRNDLAWGDGLGTARRNVDLREDRSVKSPTSGKAVREVDHVVKD